MKLLNWWPAWLFGASPFVALVLIAPSKFAEIALLYMLKLVFFLVVFWRLDGRWSALFAQKKSEHFIKRESGIQNG